MSERISSRYWTFIVYPESAPPGWERIIEATGVQFAVSPLHDRDTWDELDERDDPDHKAGTLKKAHWHVLICWGNTTTMSAVKSLAKEINGTTVKRVISPLGIYQYLYHKNNPEKAQYDRDQIRLFNGLQPEDLAQLSKADERNLYIAALTLAESEKLKRYNDLLLASMHSETWELFDFLCTHTLYASKICDGVYQRLKENADAEYHGQRPDNPIEEYEDQEETAGEDQQ